MRVPRNIILDLLPLYQAGELSDESRALVEQHLAADAELAKLAERAATASLAEEIPVPLTQSDELITYRKAREAIVLRTVALAAAMAIVLAATAAVVMYFTSVPSSSVGG